jgi:hypothetical protein
MLPVLVISTTELSSCLLDCISTTLAGRPEAEVRLSVPQFMRKLWTAEEVLQLRKLARQNTPAQVIARKLGRSIDSVYVKASREGLSLRVVPTNQSG